MNDAPRLQRLRFGPFVLDRRRAELLRDGAVVALRPKPFALLAALAEQPGTLLSKEALLAAVWPGVVVTDDSLTQAVHDLRAALGDDGPRLIRTVARRGYRFDADVADADAPTASHAVVAPAPPEGAGAARSPRWRAAGVLAVAGVVVAGAVHLAGGLAGRWDLYRPAFLAAGAAAQAAKAPRLSIVVLPLEPEPGSDGGAWFGDSLSADLIRDLGHISGSLVISRDTALTYRGRQADPRAVARELNVRHVVRGTVARHGNEVRLHLALIDGETGRQQWAEKFTLDRADLQRSLADVTGVVSRMLGVEVYRAEGRRAMALGADQVDADDLAMQGFAFWFRGLSRENTLEALRLFEAAVARDPDSLRGWLGVGLMNGTARNMGWAQDPAAALAREAEARRQMERIDSNDMYTQLGRVGPYYRTEDFAGLLQFAHTLVERFPNHPGSHHQQQMAFMKLGRFDECVAPSLRAIRLGPRDPMVSSYRVVLAFCHFFAARYREAADEARLAVEANAALAGPQMVLAAALARSGQADEAQKIVRENEGRRLFKTDGMRTVLAGSEPRLVEGRERLVATLKELGVP